MRRTKTITLAFLLALGVQSGAGAVEPLAIYDNFNRGALDPNLWDARIIEPPIFESVRMVTQGSKLRLFARVYGDTSATDGGRNFQPLRLWFANSAAVTAMESWVRVNFVRARGCPGPSGTNSRIGYRMSGYFYNDGSGGAGDATGDVWASFELRRQSNSTAPAGELKIVGNVFHCQDPNCDTGRDLYFSDTDFGTVALGELIRLLLRFDPATTTFTFQRNFQPAVAVPIGIPNNGPPAFRKRIGLRANVENCAESPRPVVSMDTDVFLVRTNESAAP